MAVVEEVAMVAAEHQSRVSSVLDADTVRDEADASEPGQWTLSSLRGRPLPEPEALVYLLAYARARPYYVNVASRTMFSGSLVNAYTTRNAIYRTQKRRYGQERETPLYLVYFECHGDYDAALARCAHIWAMPHAWQRSLIERFNDQWLNVIDELIAYPCSTHYVGEDGLVALGTPERAAGPR